MGGVLVRDAGQLTIHGTVVFDLETGELISEDVDVVVKGPHPFFFFTEEDFEELDDQICAALT